MSDDICLWEYQNWEGALSDDDVLFIQGEFATKLTYRRELRPTGEIDVLNPNQYVGVLTLPSGRRIELRPKMAVANVFYMLSVAEGLPRAFREQLATYDDFDDILEFIAAYFAGLVEDQIDQGLYRTYVEREDNLSVVRGRIAFAEDLRRNGPLRHRTYCRYSELTWDVPENQILRQVAHLLSGWQFRADVRRRLARLDVALAEVSPTRLPATVLNHFTYHRLNESYATLHAFCRLFMEGTSLSERAGAFTFQTFLLDMNKLFERYVTVVFRDAARAAGLVVLDQAPLHLDHDQKVAMKPDLVLAKSTSWLLIADCKYKKLEQGEFKNHDVYQMLAYCTASGVHRGALIYPRHLVVANEAITVRLSGTEIHQATVPLSGTVQQLKQASTELAASLLRLAAWPRALHAT